MKNGLVQQQINERGGVRLNDDKEDFLVGDTEEDRTNDGIGGVGPDPAVDQIRVPWNRGHKGNLSPLVSGSSHDQQNLLPLW